MRRQTSVFVLLAFGSLMAGALPALGFEGRTLLFVSSFPTTISLPGHYLLVNDVLAPSSTPVVIHVAASDVTLDLNGHTIQLPGPVGTIIRVSGINVVVRGGRAVGGAIGIDSIGAGGVLQVRDVHLADQGTAGVQVASAGIAEVRGSRIERFGTAGFGGGIVVRGTTVARVSGNALADGRATAIDVQATSAEVRDNIVDGVSAAGDGILLGASFSFGVRAGIVRGNTVRDVAAGDGIRAASGSHLLLDNTVTAGRQGMRVETQVNRLARNVVTRMGSGGLFDGLLVNGSRVLVEDNVAEANTGCGLHFSPFAGLCGYRGNMLRDNAGPCTLGVNDQGTGNTNAGGNL